MTCVRNYLDSGEKLMEDLPRLPLTEIIQSIVGFWLELIAFVDNDLISMSQPIVQSSITELHLNEENDLGIDEVVPSERMNVLIATMKGNQLFIRSLRWKFNLGRRHRLSKGHFRCRCTGLHAIRMVLFQVRQLP